MGPFRRITLGALLAIAGCDVGTAVVLLSREDGGDDDPPLVTSSPKSEFKVWVSWLPEPAAADGARADLIASNGNPAAPLWAQLLGSGVGTTLFDPAVDPASINTILIQATAGQNYRLDSVEILDDEGRVLEHASGTTWSNLVNPPGEMLGPPDGVDAVTNAAGSTNAFIFTRYAGPIERFQINGHAEGVPPAPGDVMAVGGFTSGSDERPGGLAIDPDGLIHLTLSVNNDIRLVRYGLDAAFVDGIQIDSSVNATFGSHSVALDPSGEIFTTATIGDGKVLIRSFHPDLGSGWNRTIYSGKQEDRVEANGIALDESGNVVVAGGMNSAQGLNHWLSKLDGGNGSVIFDFRPGGDPGETYWHGVTTGPGNLIYTTGDLTSGLLDVVQILTGRFSPAGAGQWEDLLGDTDPLGDVGHSVALDSAGNLFTGGSFGTTVQGRNGALIRYGPNGGLSQVITYNGPANGDDEILDIAVETVGSDTFTYAVGYETVAGQGQNFWVRKYDANFNPVWTRTHDGGVGNDRAISVAIHGDQLVVAGYQTATGGLTKFVLRVYAK